MIDARRCAAVAAMAGLLLAAACGDDDAEAERAELEAEGHNLPASPEDSEADVDLADLNLSLTEVASFTEPIDLVTRESDDALFVAEQEGRVFRLVVSGEGEDRTYTADDEPVVDISDEVVSGGEQGLLGIAFSPEGHRLYLSYSVDPDGGTRIISYEYAEQTATDGSASQADDDAAGDDDADDLAGADEAAGDEAAGEDDAAGEDEAADDDAAAGEDEQTLVGGVDPASRKEIFAADQPQPNHNGGQILFGPDGYLYLGLGDGGGGGDPDDNGQDTSTLLGTVLRIDPESTVDEAEPYVVPDDNPFADGADGEPEIWLYGVRNPWRFSFDAVTGDLWVGDVGQDNWEEISRLPATEDDDGARHAGRGANLGWNEMEGSHPFEGGSNPDDGVLPVYEYPIEGETACAVVGGFAYSGKAIPELDGAYVFGDSCDPQAWALGMDDGQVGDATPLDGVAVNQLSSIAEDADHELYFLSLTGPVYRLDPA